MPGGHRKRNKQSTGTVPKIKPYHVSTSPNVEERLTAYANNLTSYGHHLPDSFNFLRNRRGTQQNNYFTMDAAMDGFLPSVQNTFANETTANTSSSNSRRNSSGSTLKCDNITKYPDKNQVEQKLEQIREYLKITSSLMSSMRNTDEQTIENGMDELSLHGTSSNIRNDIDINLDDPNHEIDALKEQQLSLMQLQQKAEYKLRGARQIHSNLLQAANESNSITNAKDNKNFSDFDAAIRELEERAKRLRPAEPNRRIQDHFLAGVETLHNQMMSMRCANNEREHLIEALDNQDAALRSEHEELQTKLVELQKKKSQVDMLVAQLQSFGEEEDGDVDKKLPARVSNDTGTGVKPKQVNKNKKEQGSWRVEAAANATQTGGGNKSKRKWNDKKKGLEDIMGTHKASTSNLNHNVGFGADNKSEINIWSPSSPPASATCSAERMSRYRYNDDRPDVNPYEITSDLNLYHQPPMIESPDDKPPLIFYADKPDSPDYWNQPRSNVEHNDKPEVHEKLQWVKRMCDTMQEHQPTSNCLPENQAASNVSLNQQNVRQLRNNLTPSQLSEPLHVANLELQQPSNEMFVPYRRPGCPCPKCQTEDSDAAESADESPAEGPAEVAPEVPVDLSVVDILKQFCELMWTQQGEFQSLKSNVAWIQNKLDSMHLGPREDNAALFQNLPPYHFYANAPSCSNQKVTHVSAASSLPNLNQYLPPPVHMKPKSTDYAGVPKERSSDPSSNCVKYNMQAFAHANNLLRAVSSNQGPVMANPMWNGQALNNQVAPGNRANNYWDNFRSYSRQNLFSTKNIDLRNPSALDRSNAINEPTHPFMVPRPVCKSEHGSTTVTLQENSPHGRCIRYEANPTPDVLNVNHGSAKGGDRALAPSRGERYNNTDEWTRLPLGPNSSALNHSNERNRRRNEWAEDVAEEQVPKSKAFAESREKVYKEVASLISANESRPQFLIQLFKGLQMIDDSDAFRVKTLQAIQRLVAESTNERTKKAPHQISEQPSEQPANQSSWQPAQQSSQQTAQLSSVQPAQLSSVQPAQQSPLRPAQQPDAQPRESKTALKKLPFWSPKSLKKEEVVEKSSKHQMVEDQIGPFLDEHGSDVVTNKTIVELRYLLTGCQAFGRLRRDVNFWQHFAKVAEEALLQYRGNRIDDVKGLIIQTIVDLDFDKGKHKFVSDQQLPHLVVERGHNKSDFIQGVGVQEQQNEAAGLLEQTANDQQAFQQLSEQPPQHLSREPPQQLSLEPSQQLSRDPPQQPSRRPDQQFSRQPIQQPNNQTVHQNLSTLPPLQWPKAQSNFKILNKSSVRQFVEMEIGSYLDHHRNDIIRDATILSMTQLLFASSSVHGNLALDAVFAVVESALQPFIGSRLGDVRDGLLQTLANVVPGEVFTLERRADITNGEPHHHNTNFPREARRAQEQPCDPPTLPKTADNIENEDLAEADQSRIIKEGAVEEDEEEEGAVGGVVDAIATESDDVSSSTETCAEDGESSDTAIEGLDQVPTKLPMKENSRSSTPDRDQAIKQSDSAPF